MKGVLWLSALLLCGLTPPASAQEVPPQLAKVSEALDCLRGEGDQGWRRERIQPLTGGRSVLVDVWVSAGRRVKVSVTHYPSAAAAAESIRSFASTPKAKEVPGVGDEAYSWGHGYQIALRVGNVTAYVSAITDIATLTPSVESAERAALERLEMAALNKQFAKTMASVLANPSAACESRER